VTSKGQMVIPVAIRRRYGIGAGTEIRIEEVPGGLLLRPVAEDAIDRLCGILAGKGFPDRIEKEPDRDIR
jgi:AbrB family looped-hinge helix DNA binding protein